MRAEDGRSGRVMSIRVTDAERAELTAAAKEAQRDNVYARWGPPAVGPWIVKAALEKARSRLQAGNTKLEHGSTKARPRKGKR